MLKRILGTLLVLVLAAAGALAVLVALEVRVPLDPLRTPVETAAEAVLGREISIDGDMVLVPTLWPTLEVGGVEVANPPDWPEGIFASAGQVRLQLGIAPLLSGQIQIADITARDVSLNLESNAQGEPSWRFGSTEAAENAESAEARPEPPQPQGEGPSVRFAALENLTLENIALSYADQQLGKTLRFQLERLQGAVPEGQPIRLELAGSLQDKPFRLDLQAGSFEQLTEDQGTWPLTLTGDLAGAPLSAEGEYLSGDEPEISASLDLGRIDFGAFLAWLGIADGLQAKVQTVTARTAIRGDSLAELLAASEAEFSLQGGAWTLVHPTGARIDLGIDEGRISVLPNEPITVSLDARIDGNPLAMGISAPALTELLKRDGALSMELAIDGGGAKMTLTTDVTMPIDARNLAFRMQLDGSRLDAMNALLKADLPPFGPYGLSGTLAISPQGYAVQGLDVRVANTRLNGNLSLNIAAKPRSLDVDLRSKRLQIDDFRVEGWSPTEGSGQAGAAPAEAAETPSPAASRGAPPLLSREMLSSLDAKISVAVDEVLFGSEPLGRGSLLMRLDGGRLSLEPLEVDLPGGSAEARFVFHPMESTTEIALAAKVPPFDYGVIARRIDLESEIGGKLALDVDIKARANALDEILLKGNGHFDFGLWPEQMNADLFELWAVNVVSALMSEMDKDGSSKVNCIVARFQLQDGVMNDRVIFADTTKMRIEGSATVDFPERTLGIAVGPKAKKPEFFSLAVPVGLSGTFDDFGIDINPVALTAKTLSFVTSPLHVPLRKIFVKGEPADGKAACAEVWGAGDPDVAVPQNEAEAVETETASDADFADQETAEGEETTPGPIRKGLGRLRDRIEDSVDDSSEQEPAIDVLNLSD